MPPDALPEPVARALQGLLDSAVDNGTVRGVTASVINVHSGSWSGAAGEGIEGNPLAPTTKTGTASVDKSFIAAQILRLAEQGTLRLEGQAKDYFPAELEGFEANAATLRDLLSMRSGLRDPSVTGSLSLAELVGKVPEPSSPAGSRTEYTNINYILLAGIIEHLTGQELGEAVGSGVLDRPGLEGLEYLGGNEAVADDIDYLTDSSTLARWGYELYGGFVLADASLQEMLDFRGEFYGLGAIDFTHEDAQGGYAEPSVGHGGLSTPHVVRLVAFPESGVVLAVQANAGSFERIKPLVEELRDTARP